MTPPSDVLLTLERYYDTVPRSLSTTEECGPFTIFVPTEVTKWTFYARPRLGLTEEVTADDVRRVLDRRAELGLPRNIEWVDEVTPSLRPGGRGRRSASTPSATRCWSGARTRSRPSSRAWSC